MFNASWKRTTVSTLLALAMLPLAQASAESISVQSGDTLGKIAYRYGVTVEQLKAANQLQSDMLLIGQNLYIPPDSQVYTVRLGEATQSVKADKPWVTMSTYTVSQGDTPWTISIAHGIPQEEFLQANKLTEKDYLQIGQTVKIPVHHIPLTSTPGAAYGEYLDWFEAAQYLFPINTVAVVTDFETKRKFKVKRTIGSFHSDTEPLTAADAAIIKDIWGGSYSWKVRPVLVEVNGRKLAASMTSMPHSIEYITDNSFDGHFDIHFPGSLRHMDNLIDPDHQAAIKIAAGLSK
ncbi:LysM peptidoglycan-binding domain-containing protein [Brevibacillus ruminantium]|uniref:LysM peptidoglycan-binding domain-containing protein n=1 Tax=Brevibacillus ruminantium TaxID=2950604 RepID=A0ABY4WJM7_9BACL|nr:LysM peptidoglycan-binding domain-containing protein [Brevibacillus ruminantium]USG67233.1 LysM peptidoglycan-binding domain-containing protein [Brevibacillus ruminantium]